MEAEGKAGSETRRKVRKEQGEKQVKKMKERDFPGGAVVKNPPANAGNMASRP